MIELNKERVALLLQIARESIKEAVTGRKIIDREKLLKAHPWLNEKGAVFVTLNKEHHLRGCIGSIIAHRSLLDDLIDNAKAAALRDPRFKPLQSEELNDIEIEISLLTPPKELYYKDIQDLKQKIRKGKDGVIINYRGYQATYLPSVWEQLDSFESFFMTLCQKAGLPGNCLELHPTIYTYEAIKLKEDTSKGQNEKNNS